MLPDRQLGISQVDSENIVDASPLVAMVSGASDL